MPHTCMPGTAGHVQILPEKKNHTAHEAAVPLQRYFFHAMGSLDFNAPTTSEALDFSTKTYTCTQSILLFQQTHVYGQLCIQPTRAGTLLTVIRNKMQYCNMLTPDMYILLYNR